MAIPLWSQSPHGKEFKMECVSCHSSESWKINLSQLNFNHTETGFELNGQHNSVQCIQCHNALNFNNTPNTCNSCHTDIHNQTVGDDCVQCHNTQSWLVNNIQSIHETSRFPLIAAHATADCQQCHTSVNNLQFKTIGIECVDCHKADYNAAKEPNHLAGGFSLECVSCHNLTGYDWSGQNINHDFFPLIQGHKTENCFSCHEQNRFSGLSQNCYSCHKSDYNRTITLNHPLLAISTDCASCHTLTPGWRPASFEVHNDYWQLNGTHASIKSDCASCHNPTFTNTPNTCVGCHQDAYNNTQNPSHIVAGFSTDCLSCHTETSWKPATFDHDNQYFPINSGKHREAWNNCIDCHTTPSNFKAFSCISCHEHSNKQKVDDDHDEVPGYIYASPSCYSCHPQGTSND